MALAHGVWRWGNGLPQLGYHGTHRRGLGYQLWAGLDDGDLVGRGLAIDIGRHEFIIRAWWDRRVHGAGPGPSSGVRELGRCEDPFWFPASKISASLARPRAIRDQADAVSKHHRLAEILG